MANVTNIPRQLEVGDTIKVPRNIGLVTITDYSIVIGEILYQEPWAWRNAYYIEFKDNAGRYHFWQQKYDGGTAILADM